MNPTLDKLARDVVKRANDNSILRRSTYEKDELLYYSIILLAEFLGEPIIDYELLGD